jgi:hypothetical protein
MKAASSATASPASADAAHPQLSARQQPLEHSGIRACYVDDLRPASSSGYQRDVPAGYSERRGYRSEGGLGRLAAHGRLGDPDNQSAGLLTANARASRAGPDSDSDAHQPSVRYRAA